MGGGNSIVRELTAGDTALGPPIVIDNVAAYLWGDGAYVKTVHPPTSLMIMLYEADLAWWGPGEEYNAKFANLWRQARGEARVDYFDKTFTHHRIDPDSYPPAAEQLVMNSEIRLFRHDFPGTPLDIAVVPDSFDLRPNLDDPTFKIGGRTVIVPLLARIIEMKEAMQLPVSDAISDLVLRMEADTRIQTPETSMESLEIIKANVLSSLE